MPCFTFPFPLMRSRLPETKTQWTKQAEQLECDRTSIHELEDKFVTSASEIGDRQYLTLRILWVEMKGLDCPVPFEDKEARLRAALDFLRHHEAW